MKLLDRTAGVALAAVGIQALMVFAFTAPAAHSAPHKVPLAVSAPAPLRTAIEQRLEQAAPGAFKVREVADDAAARAALTDRTAYGAIVADTQGPRMLVASAAGPTVAAMLTEVGSHLAPSTAGSPAPAVTDVVPAAAKDPHGGAFTSMVLPVVMSSLIGGVLITLKLRRLRDRALAALLFGIGGGLALALLAGHTLAFLPGSYLALTAAVAAPVLAVAGFTTAAASLLGRRGFPLAGLTMMLLANPLSAAASAPELLPTPWGAMGQDLPAGAAATLIRSTAFFHGEGATHATVVLSLWIALSAAMLAAAGLRARRAPVVMPEDVMVTTRTAEPAAI
ncbi:hypothetical protein [Catenulispora subtropica]|uniref:Membrane protein n=1 Tax=Catenulispora subtropica TaxID=450798 RepID=A0ABP5CAD4_9ACTN